MRGAAAGRLPPGVSARAGSSAHCQAWTAPAGPADLSGIFGRIPGPGAAVVPGGPCQSGTSGPGTARGAMARWCEDTWPRERGNMPMMWGHGSSAAWLWLGIGLLAIAGATALALALAARRGPGHAGTGPAARELDERFARGDIGEDEFARRRAVLNAGRPARPASRWHWNTALVIGLAAIAALGAGSVALAATTAAPAPAVPAAAGDCAVPSLPGQVVSVRLWDMGAMMGGRYPGGGYYPGWMMGGRYPGMMGGGSYPGSSAAAPGRWMGMMSVTADRSSVSAGTVSFRVHNAGGLVHELVVLPLPAAGAGTRPVGSDGTVSEQSSAGEASATCAAGTGEGITPGADGWVTLHLAPGRYELICNLPGHYAMGMFTELDVR